MGGVAVELQAVYQLYHLVDGHSIAKHTGEKLGIVPQLFVEFVRKSLDSRLVAVPVYKLEVVAFAAVFEYFLDNLTLFEPFGQQYSVFVVGKSREYFVWFIVFKSYKCYPLLLLVLETQYLAVEHFGAF